MTQRKWERIAGWIAFVSWVAVFALGSLMFLVAGSAPKEPKPVAVAPQTAKAHKSKRATKPIVASTVQTPERQQLNVTLEAIGDLDAFSFIVAIAATGWWSWRRRKRITAETYAEAFARSQEKLSRRDRASVSWEPF